MSAAALKFTSDQTKPKRLVQRIMGGEAIDPANDDLFILPLEETKRAIEQKRKLIGRLEAEMVALQAEIEAERRTQEGLVAKYRKQQEAVAHYQEHGGEIPDCLIPDASDAESERLAALAKKEREEVDLAAPDGWERSSVRTDDKYVYVTFRKERTTDVEQVKRSLKSQIKACFDVLSALPAAKRKERLQLTMRIGRWAYAPIEANGP
jgi:hypothetical protein